MRILWYNWRDIKNPEAGGAEVFTHEVCKRLVRKEGVESITIFTSSFADAKNEEVIDGVKIVRSGDKYSVYKLARKFYDVHKEEFDIVVDEINTKPFDTPSFVRNKPIVALIHQLAREFWFYETPFPINIVGYLFLEKHWLKKYKEFPTIAVSKSTEEDLLDLGFKQVLIVPEGIGFKPLDRPVAKEATPTVLFVGRLKKAKRPDHAINAFKVIKDEIPEARLWVVGDGYMLKDLKNMARTLFGNIEEKDDGSNIINQRAVNKEGDGGSVLISNVKDRRSIPEIASSSGDPAIEFFGKVSMAKKLDLMSRAHVLLVPGVREGWGLVVTEANAMGTAAVAYDVPGLRDSVSDSITGVLVPRGDSVAMAIETIDLLKHGEKLAVYSRNALQNSRQFNWDTTATHIFDILTHTLLQSNKNQGEVHAA